MPPLFHGHMVSELAAKLRIGCSGWGYDDWLGGFYPPKTPKSDYLKLYSSVFNTVEVDSSFYRTPGPAMTKAWYKTAPADFTFTMKMPKRITHEKKLNGVAENLGWFYASAKELNEKAGPLVAQLPPSIKYDVHWSLMQDFVKGFDAKYAHAFVFFNNHYAGFGPGSVNEFRRLAGMIEYEFPGGKGGSAGQKGLADFG